jgi:hypothetical protein
MSTDDEKQSLDDAIERLEAERQRRIDAKIERGEAVRAERPIVVGVPDPRKDYAAVYRDTDGREVYPAEPYAVIVTGVPRAGRDDDVEVSTSEPSRDRDSNSTPPAGAWESGGRDAATTMPAGPS